MWSPRKRPAPTERQRLPSQHPRRQEGTSPLRPPRADIFTTASSSRLIKTVQAGEEGEKKKKKEESGEDLIEFWTFRDITMIC